MTNSLKQTLANCAHKAFSVFMAIALIMSMVVITSSNAKDASAVTYNGKKWDSYNKISSNDVIADSLCLNTSKSNLKFSTTYSDEKVKKINLDSGGVAIVVKDKRTAKTNSKSAVTYGQGDKDVCTLRFNNAGTIGNKNVDVIIKIKYAHIDKSRTKITSAFSDWTAIGYITKNGKSLWLGGDNGTLSGKDEKYTLHTGKEIRTNTKIVWHGTDDTTGLKYFYKFSDIDGGANGGYYCESVWLNRDDFVSKSKFTAHKNNELYTVGKTVGSSKGDVFYLPENKDYKDPDGDSFRRTGFYAPTEKAAKSYDVNFYEGNSATALRIYAPYSDIPGPNKTVNKSSAQPGDTLTWTIKHKTLDYGKNTAITYSSWTIQDTLPSYVTYKSATVSYDGKALGSSAGSGSYSNGTYTWKFSSDWLDNVSHYDAKTVTVKITATVNPIKQNTTEKLENSAKSTISGIDYWTTKTTTTVTNPGGSATIAVNKNLVNSTGENESWDGKSFTVTCTPVNGAPSPTSTSITLDEDNPSNSFKINYTKNNVANGQSKTYQYRIKETVPSNTDGIVYDTNTYTVSVKATNSNNTISTAVTYPNNAKTVDITNKKATINLNLYKYYKTASTGDTKNNLEGAKFAIYEGDSWSTAQNNKVGEGTTDDNGNLEFGGIINPNSTYWLFETEAPEKFEKVDPIALKTGSNPNTATVYSLTWKAGVASTSKYKNADNPLTFASATNGAEPTSGTGNMSRGLNVVKVNGNYYSFNFTDYYCDEAALVVTNGVPSSVKIANYDYIQSFDQAASYKLTAVSKEEVENSITPAQDADYYLNEPQGTITADSSYTMTVEVEDKQKEQPDLEIWKYRLNGSEKNNLRDAQFSLYKGNTWSAAKNNEVASGTTDEDGMLGFPAVFDKNSTYWLVETKAPNGYLEIDPIVIKIGDSYDTADIYASEYVSSDNYNIGEQTDVWNLITSNGNNEYDVEIEDPPGSVNANIYKYALSEEGRKLPLPEASFTIYEGDDWMVAQDNEVFSGETDGNGEIGADGIIKPNKTYWIIETEAPKDYKVAEPIVLKTSRDLKTAETYAINQTDEGYEIGDKKSDLAVSDEGGFDLDIVDELAPTIGLHKYTSDSDGNKTSLEGAKFAIYRGSKWEDAQEDKVAEATTDANGNIDFNFGVVNNDTYWVVETEAPDGYYIAMPYVLVISDDYNSATYYTTSSTEDGYEIADELGTVDSKDNKFVLEIDDDGIPHMPSAGVTPWQGGTAAAVLVMAAAAVELVRRRIATRTDK